MRLESNWSRVWWSVVLNERGHACVLVTAALDRAVLGPVVLPVHGLEPCSKLRGRMIP